jgi:exosortase
MLAKDRVTAFEPDRDLSHLLRIDQTRGNRTKRNLSTFGILLATLILFSSPLRAAVSLSFHDDRYFQIIVAPFLCMFLIYWERAEIFSKARFSPRAGIPLLSLAALLCLAFVHRLSLNNQSTNLPLAVLAIILVWMAAFILCYGTRSFKIALFPLCCLFLMVPVPPAFMDRIAVGLQHASAATSYAILRLVGIPVFRQGMTFLLPGLRIEIAPECSGIRSCLVFMIAAVMASHVCLRSGWRKLALIVLTVPIAIFKNAVRIVVISSMSAYVNRAFLDSPLHRYGGPVFALVGLALFVPLLLALQRSENRRSGSETELKRVSD